MKKIVIVGAGGHCKVVLDTIEEINKIENTFETPGMMITKKSEMHQVMRFWVR